MQFDKNGKSTSSDLDKLEHRIGFKLPHDYRKFLQQTNGGAFALGYPSISADTVGDIACDALFGMDMPKALDLLFWYQEMADEIPSSSLLIGKAPSGGFFLLCCIPESKGVYFYDHGYTYPCSSDDENTYFIADTFSGFAKLAGIDSY